MKLLRLALAALAMAVPLAGAAQDYPSRTIRIVVPYAAGGGVDSAARVVAQHLTTALGQNVVVDPKPGAATVIGTEFVARAPSDGYTLLLTGGSTMSMLPLTHPTKLPFDPLEDFEPVGMVSRLPFFLVTSSKQPYKSVKELMDAARAKPEALSYASNGTGSMGHLGTETLVQAAGAKMVHVPYAGFAPALSDLITGRVSIVMADMASIRGQLQAGTLRPLAVASAERSRFMPDAPTLAEAGYPGAAFEIWLALYAPAKTPPDVIKRVSTELSRFLASPQGRDAFTKLGHEADPADGKVVRERIVAEQKAFAPAARAAGLGQAQGK
ncbi:tripartite tricarboxylate transporter substrate binding protein [Ramlibacter sp. AN1015]|uniref:Bug family tripartite tricarboxylate transporter substrate binding protein n=1 Tax=Ramlibacter sp. AN1015 TaxID=3133428 RepID=UPI0030BF4D82